MMRLLYVAPDQTVPGTLGGSVHVQAVASGLAELGHTVQVLASPGEGEPTPDGVIWRPLAPPLGLRQLRLARVGAVTAAAREFGADAILERYYNFGGEGIMAATRLGIVAGLEVNAPVVDHPGSTKRIVDRAVLVEPMRRWRDWQCRHADLIVTPSRAILPEWIEDRRLVRLEWGADTRTFRPHARGDRPFDKQPGDTIAIFAGAFRSWHGAIHLARAIEQLRARGRSDIKAVFIGDGPELPAVRDAAARLSGVTFVGAIPHDRMPAALAGADVGVAPFDVRAHASLSLAFYWSPLKVFEYMAAGLAVVAPDIERLRELVTHGIEGILYDPRDPAALSRSLEMLADPARRSELGQAARARVERDYSWQAHCRQLADALERAIRTRRRPDR